MRKTFCVASCLLLLALPGQSAAQGQPCRVSDPTGTPLNVRDAPNGGVISTLPNGLSVDAVEDRRLGTKIWRRVSRDGDSLGWVFGAYLDCTATADSEKSAPMRPRVAPN